MRSSSHECVCVSRLSPKPDLAVKHRLAVVEHCFRQRNRRLRTRTPAHDPVAVPVDARVVVEQHVVLVEQPVEVAQLGPEIVAVVQVPEEEPQIPLPRGPERRSVAFGRSSLRLRASIPFPIPGI